MKEKLYLNLSFIFIHDASKTELLLSMRLLVGCSKHVCTSFILTVNEQPFSYLGFSVAPPVRLRKNSSLRFCIASSAVKPWFPFSNVFCPEDEVLLWSTLAGSAAEAEINWDIKSEYLQSILGRIYYRFQNKHLPSFLVFLFFLPPCSLPLSPPFVSIIDFTVFWDFSDWLKDRIVGGLRALLLSSASLVVNIWCVSAQTRQERFWFVKHPCWVVL